MLSTLATRIGTLFGWHRGKDGQALIEYSLIMCLIVIVVLLTLIVLGNQVRDTYCNIAGAVVSA